MAFTGEVFKGLACFLVLLTSSVCQLAKPGTHEFLLPHLSRAELMSVEITPDLPGPQEVKWRWRFKSAVSTSFLRLHLVAGSLVRDVPWWLVIRNGEGVEVDRLDAGSFSTQPGAGEAWTRLIDGDRVVVELHSPGLPLGLALRIDRYNYEFAQPAVKAIVGPDKREDITQYKGKQPPYYEWGRAVAAIFFPDPDTHEETNCTGFLLSTTLLLTNHHCISREAQLRVTRIVFGFETGAQPERHSVTAIVASDLGLDFSLLRVDTSGPWPSVILETSPIRERQSLVLIQHARGRPKLISAKGCKVQVADAERLSPPEADFYHECDSEGGSSGSPLFDADTGGVVGLHHLERRVNPINLGVKIGLILEKIRKESPQAFAEIMSRR